MRISGNNNIDTSVTNKETVTNNITRDAVVKQGSNNIARESATFDSMMELINDEDKKVKIKEAVNKMNEILEVYNNTSKFMFHEGLERYYVTVVDRDTDEVVKEIPSKKLLDAFYEMQKMLGMIVDEKI